MKRPVRAFIFEFLLLVSAAHYINRIGANESQQNDGAVDQVSQGQNAVSPVIYHPDEIDSDYDGIEDSLESLIASQNASLCIPVIVTLHNSVVDLDSDCFVKLGGSVEYVYRYVSFGFSG